MVKLMFDMVCSSVKESVPHDFRRSRQAQPVRLNRALKIVATFEIVATTLMTIDQNGNCMESRAIRRMIRRNSTQ
jgi:hypothetical protein